MRPPSLQAGELCEEARRMDLELVGKRALVTGGSKGIGYAAAERLAVEGASVAIVARREEELAAARRSILAAAPGATILTVSADVATAEGTAHAVEATTRAFGGLDILVNNAGTASAQPILDVSDDLWQSDLDLKVFGAIRMVRLAAPHLRAAGGGSIVNVLSIFGKQPSAASSPSSVSRAAGLALTKAMSKDLAADNIRVNCVCVGLIVSEQITRAAGRRFPDVPLDDAFAQMTSHVPLGRIGRAAEAGDMIAYLSSVRASYVTGTAVNVDGGTSAVL